MKMAFLLAGIGLTACAATMGLAQSALPPAGEQQAMRHAPSPRTRAEAEARVKARFAALDANKDGFLSADELRGSTRPHPLRSEANTATADHAPSNAASGSERAARLFAAMDKDGNGQIDKAEFERFQAGRGQRLGWAGGAGRGMRMRQALAARMFGRDDADHDGKVSLAEAEKAALDRFDRADTNHDGVIDDTERKAARKRMAMRWRERRAHGSAGDAGTPSPTMPE